MNCETCKIKFDTDTGCCPLCHEKIGEARYQNRLYPPRPRMITKKGLSLFSQIYFFVSFMTVMVTGLLNYLANKKFTWSVVVLCSLLYFYALIKNTVLNKSNIAFRLLVQAVLMCLFLFAIDYFATSNSKWSLEYVIPFLLPGTTISLTVLAFSNHRKWRDYVMSILVMVVIGLIPFVFYLTKMITVYWPSLLSGLYSFFTIFGMVVFYRKKFTNELKKNFHI